MNKGEEQCTHNVLLTRVHETTVAVYSNKYYIFLCVCVCVRARADEGMRVCVCILARARARVCVGGVGVRKPACACACVGLFIQHASRRRHIFCALSGFHHIFRYELINGKIFGNKSLNIICVLIFSKNFV